ncbi:hypothetical protein GCM10025784_22420 [Citricoccus nitrophenolicus]
MKFRVHNRWGGCGAVAAVDTEGTGFLDGGERAVARDLTAHGPQRF